LLAVRVFLSQSIGIGHGGTGLEIRGAERLPFRAAGKRGQRGKKAEETKRPKLVRRTN